MTEIVNCAVYARYSTNNQREASIEDQIRKCREFATSRGWRILDEHIYYDKARSGATSNNRDGFKELMRIAMSGTSPFRKILVDDTSRIARNTREALDVFSLLSFYDIHVFYISQNIDTSHETAEELITINGLIDSLYIRNLAKETHRGIEGQVLKGYSSGSRRYGYRSEPVFNGKVDIYGYPKADGYLLKIQPDEADTVIRIFSLFGEHGYSAKKIVNILNKELKETGHPKPPRGQYWCVSSLLGGRKTFRGILNNEIYVGRYYWNRSASKRNPKNGKRKVFLKNNSKWIVSNRPELQIVSHELWIKAKDRQKFSQQRTAGQYTKGKSLYTSNLFTGLLKCKECGGNIVVVSGGKHSKACGCSNNWNKGESVCSNNIKMKKTAVETAIFQILNLDLATEHIIEVLYKKINSIIMEKSGRLNPSWKHGSLSEQIKRLDKEILNYVSAIRAGFISNIVRKQLEDAERLRASIEIEFLKSQKTSEGFPSISRDQILSYLTDLPRTLNLHPGFGKQFLSCLLREILVIPSSGKWLFDLNLLREKKDLPPFMKIPSSAYIPEIVTI